MSIEQVRELLGEQAGLHARLDQVEAMLTELDRAAMLRAAGGLALVGVLVLITVILRAHDRSIDALRELLEGLS